MDIPTKPGSYRSFLLRLWLDGDSRSWRFSLEDPHTEERRGFADLERLTEFLKEAMGQTKENDLFDQP